MTLPRTGTASAQACLAFFSLRVPEARESSWPVCRNTPQTLCPGYLSANLPGQYPAHMRPGRGRELSPLSLHSDLMSSDAVGRYAAPWFFGITA